MRTKLDALVERTAQMFGMADGLAFGRGAAALHALFAALARRDGPGEVVVPAVCCETVPLAALYAGHDVRIADVSPESLCLTPQSASSVMSERTRALVVVHIFGLDADAKSFSSLREGWPGVAFVEDIAHAVGGRASDGSLLGSQLDYTMLSLAPDKILPGDGGMLILGAKGLTARDAREAAPEAGRSAIHGQLALSLRNLVHGLADLWRAQPLTDTEPSFRSIAHAYRDLIAYRGEIDDPEALDQALERLEETRDRRYERFSRYRDEISPDRAVVANIGPDGMCWRCTILLPTPARAREVTAELRSQGVHASNHYFPLNKLFGGTCPVAEDVGLRVVNLWVSDAASDDMVEAAIRVING